jgi:predicted CxxxxCH...CXXCH cytochrome family protein
MAGAFSCATCHPVPSDLSHVGPDGNRANVVLSAAGQAQLPAAMGAYSQASGTCTTYCHGASASPAWSSTGLVCGTCHGLPPTTGGHPSVTGPLTICVGCHGETLNADGSINLAGGKHLNGHVEASGHPDWTSPATHGPKFFLFLSGGTGAIDCTGCHGTTYDGGMGPSCNACHATAGWTGWQTNCSFCHGAKTPAAKAGYAMASHAEWSAPPDALSQRLTGLAAPARTGAHQAHLSGRGSASNGAYIVPALPCATCHTVPTTMAHAAPFGRAPVVLRGYGALPANLGTYNPAAGTCTTYCHGTTLVNGVGGPIPAPVWSGGELGCAGCHGAPPATGQHDFHVNSVGAYCADCHYATVLYPTGPADSGQIQGAHLNGAREVQFSPFVGTTWDGNSCTSACHGGEAYSWQ